jgi:hypothetical protein
MTWAFFVASYIPLEVINIRFSYMMGNAYAWRKTTDGCPWTTNGEQWPCTVGDIMTAFDLIIWYPSACFGWGLLMVGVCGF